MQSGVDLVVSSRNRGLPSMHDSQIGSFLLIRKYGGRAHIFITAELVQHEVGNVRSRNFLPFGRSVPRIDPICCRARAISQPGWVYANPIQTASDQLPLRKSTIGVDIMQ